MSGPSEGQDEIRSEADLEKVHPDLREFAKAVLDSDPQRMAEEFNILTENENRKVRSTAWKGHVTRTLAALGDSIYKAFNIKSNKEGEK